MKIGRDIYEPFGGITGDLAGYFLSLCELAQLLSLVVLSLGMENWK